jgi:hypothetical protein
MIALGNIDSSLFLAVIVALHSRMEGTLGGRVASFMTISLATGRNSQNQKNASSKTIGPKALTSRKCVTFRDLNCHASLVFVTTFLSLPTVPLSNNGNSWETRSMFKWRHVLWNWDCDRSGQLKTSYQSRTVDCVRRR